MLQFDGAGLRARPGGPLMFRTLAAALLSMLLVAASVRATTYLPVTFNDLVTGADVIFVGEVIDVRPFPLASSASGRG